jgi:hypothetical protein
MMNPSGTASAGLADGKRANAPRRTMSTPAKTTFEKLLFTLRLLPAPEQARDAGPVAWQIVHEEYLAA